jgi:hypothetical protein
MVASRGLMASLALRRSVQLDVFMYTLWVPTLMLANSRNAMSIAEACGRFLRAFCPLHLSDVPGTGVSSTAAYVFPLLRASWQMHLEFGAA